MSFSTARNLSALVYIHFAISPAAVLADGLIYYLPPDGAWVRYDFKSDSMAKLPDGKSQPYPMRGRTKLSSVKKIDWKGEPHRWIEVNSEVWPAEDESKRVTRILKLLIPEKRLTRGEDPFAHVEKMYYAQSRVGQGGQVGKLQVEEIDGKTTIAEDYTRRQYELDRFRSIFPKPLKQSKPQQSTIETKLGRLNCETFDGTSELPAGTPLHGGKHWGWNRRFKCVLNEKVPFGVVRLYSQSKEYEVVGGGQKVEFEGESTLMVAEIGRDARSDIPDSW